MEEIEKYIDQVLNNSARHGLFEILAVKRFQKDIASGKWDFRIDEVEKKFKQAKIFRNTKDRFYGAYFNLQPFQYFALANIFGFYHKNSEKRRFRKYYLDIARKNGKTEFACLIPSIINFFDDIHGQETYFAATKRDQAAIGFETTRVMIKQLMEDSSYARGRVRLFANSISFPITNGVMRAVSSDSKTLDGLNPNCAIIDEFHAHPSNQVLKVMETGIGSRLNPLIIITTTAGFNKNAPCKHYRDMCERILKGDIEDDTLFCQVFAMDEEDDWEDPENWYKPNPNLGVTIEPDFLINMYKAAKNEGASSVNEFMTKNLNVWTSVNIEFIPDKVWMLSAKDPEISDEMPCWGALDLSSTRDLTVYLLLFENGSILPHFFCPQEKIEDRDNSDGVDYRKWYDEGFIEMIPGNTIDNRIIKKRILEINKEFNVKANVYDPWRAAQITQELIEQGVSMLKMNPTYTNFTEAVTELEKNAFNGNYRHGGHPILRWNNENVMLKMNAAGLFMFDKSNTKKAGAKIDGMVALAMAEFARYNKVDDKKYKGSGPVKL